MFLRSTEVVQTNVETITHERPNKDKRFLRFAFILLLIYIKVFHAFAVRSYPKQEESGYMATFCRYMFHTSSMKWQKPKSIYVTSLGKTCKITELCNFQSTMCFIIVGYQLLAITFHYSWYPWLKHFTTSNNHSLIDYPADIATHWKISSINHSGCCFQIWILCSKKTKISLIWQPCCTYEHKIWSLFSHFKRKEIPDYRSSMNLPFWYVCQTISITLILISSIMKQVSTIQGAAFRFTQSDNCVRFNPKWQKVN